MKTRIIELVIFAAMALLLYGCATSKANEFQSKIKSMPDRDLISYYHGVSDRIMDIERDLKTDESLGPTEPKKFTANMPFFLGGEGYRLVKKREKILEELKRRKLKP